MHQGPGDHALHSKTGAPPLPAPAPAPAPAPEKEAWWRSAPGGDGACSPRPRETMSRTSAIPAPPAPALPSSPALPPQCSSAARPPGKLGTARSSARTCRCSPPPAASSPCPSPCLSPPLPAGHTGCGESPTEADENVQQDGTCLHSISRLLHARHEDGATALPSSRVPRGWSPRCCIDSGRRRVPRRR